VKTDDELRGEPPAAGEPPRLAHDRMMRVGNTPPPDKRISLVLALSLILLLAMSGGWQLLLVVFSIVLMIVLHELGHYIAAKRSGMKVTEFFLGFGPKLWSVQRGETEYGIKAIPAGAYVRIIGMNNLEEVPPEDEPRTYRQQSYPKRVAVAVAGSTMHFLQALVAVFLVFTIFGAPGGHLFSRTDGPYRIDTVIDGSAAQAAGIQPGDRLLSMDGEDITTFPKLQKALANRAGKSATIELERNGQRLTVPIQLGEKDGHGQLGIELRQLAPPLQRLDPITAAGRTVTEVGTASRETLGFLGSFFSPSGLSHFADTVINRGSPAVNSTGSGSSSGSDQPVDGNRPISIIGAARFGSEITNEGAFAFLGFFASINIVIGIFNMIPLLPLDGGHLAIATYERIRSRNGRRYQVDVMKLLPLTYAVVFVLILLGVSTIFLDIVNPIHLN
jgi:membrane-associated protease RseP (regulator of RpoE activity)